MWLLRLFLDASRLVLEAIAIVIMLLFGLLVVSTLGRWAFVTVLLLIAAIVADILRRRR